MFQPIADRIGHSLADWLTSEEPLREMPLCNFERLLAEIRPCDVVLMEGRSRVSEVIKMITQSPWSHAALYVGRINEVIDPVKREKLKLHYRGDPEEPLVIEAILGQGTIVTPFSTYRNSHLRICRPRGLRIDDADRVLGFAIDELGKDYDVRQMVDMARFFFPYGFLPRRWRSSLFQSKPGPNTRNVCSSMLAQVFMRVNYPIIPVVQRELNGRLKYYRRNFRLYTPKDFDHSPYFEVIKYPLVDPFEIANYRNLPWDTTGLMCNSEEDCADKPAQLTWNAGWKVRFRYWWRQMVDLLLRREGAKV